MAQNKPFGPIPAEFALLNALPWLDQPTPAYVYDFAVIRARPSYEEMLGRDLTPSWV